MMKYNNGFPEEIVMGEGGMSVTDVNRLILSLDCDEHIDKFGKETLMRYYARERQKYLDEHYEMTPERKNKLLEVERLMWEKHDFVKTLYKLHAKQELKKQEQGIRIPARIEYHLEIGNLGMEALNDDERALFNLLCVEDRHHLRTWGYEYSYYDFATKKYVPPMARHRRTVEEDGFTHGFHMMKECYTLAWQDMEDISCFWLTVDYRYDEND